MNSERPNRLPKIKNKNPAEIQITAEQLLREANERQEEAPKIPKQFISNKDELLDYQLRKRRMFEDAIRRNRLRFNTWIKYATWEESQNELARARSVYLRALEIDPYHITIRMKYVEMELKNRNINLARNLLDQCITLLPRIDMFWYKYVYLEEMLDNVPLARQIFERWMKWEPNENAWLSYIKMEKRYNENNRVRKLYGRFVSLYPTEKNFIKWITFEEELGNYEAIDYLKELEKLDQKIYIAFAKFETRLNEIERARAIYQYGINNLPKSKSVSLYQNYTRFEKQYGEDSQIELVVKSRRRIQYEEQVKQDPYNYDTWFDYIRLEEECLLDIEKTREVYERAIANVPLVEEKKYWRRYIYLWIYYAIFEELITKDIDKARQVNKAMVNIVPHTKFTFAKVWQMYAEFEVRQMDLRAARKALGTALGKCPKNKIFKNYIELELKLREFNRVRTIYNKYLEHNPTSCVCWIKFCELEKMLGEHERCRAIYELAISMPALDMPELLWKSYIDYEVEECEYENTRKLYERLLQKTEHVKIWISYAQFELSLCDRKEFNKDLNKYDNSVTVRTRKVFERGYQSIKERGQKEDAWKDFEKDITDNEEMVDRVEKMMPRIVKKRRRVTTQTNTESANKTLSTDGSIIEDEEYYDYIFPDDDKEKQNLDLINKAHAWKERMEQLKRQKLTKKD